MLLIELVQITLVKCSTQIRITCGHKCNYKGEIRASTRANHESSWSLAEDGPHGPPHELTTSSRSAKSPVHSLDVATLYEDARWRIRIILITLRAFPERQKPTQNYKFHLPRSLHITYIGLIPNFRNTPGT